MNSSKVVFQVIIFLSSLFYFPAFFPFCTQNDYDQRIKINRADSLESIQKAQSEWKFHQLKESECKTRNESAEIENFRIVIIIAVVFLFLEKKRQHWGGHDNARSFRWWRINQSVENPTDKNQTPHKMRHLIAASRMVWVSRNLSKQWPQFFARKNKFSLLTFSVYRSSLLDVFLCSFFFHWSLHTKFFFIYSAHQEPFKILFSWVPPHCSHLSFSSTFLLHTLQSTLYLIREAALRVSLKPTERPKMP